MYKIAKLPEVTTVGQMRKLLAYYDDNTPIYVVESRYAGGGDNDVDCAFTVSESYGELVITPVLDGHMVGTLLNPDEL